jgi:hypothetical protein
LKVLPVLLESWKGRGRVSDERKEGGELQLEQRERERKTHLGNSCYRLSRPSRTGDRGV